MWPISQSLCLCIVGLGLAIASPISTLNSEDNWDRFRVDSQIALASDLREPDIKQHSRPKRQFNGGSLINDIFQIPIATLNAVSKLLFNTRTQRDKRRNPTAANNTNGSGYSTYNDGTNAISNVQTPYNSAANQNNNAQTTYQTASSTYNNAYKPYSSGSNTYNNGQAAYNNGYNAYNNGQNSYSNANNAYNNAQTAYNGGNNAYNNAHTTNYNSNSAISANSNGYTPYFKPIGYYSSHSSSISSNNIGANAFASTNHNGNAIGNSAYNRPFHYQTQQYLSNRVSRTHGAKVAELSTAADGSSFKI